MITSTVVTVTPHRLRFVIQADEDDSGVVTLTNAELVAAAREPMRSILQQAATSQSDARALLLGTGTTLNVLSPARQPQRYCRVRTLTRTANGLNHAIYVDANAVADRAQLEITVIASGAEASWIVDLEVEHSLTR